MIMIDVGLETCSPSSSYVEYFVCKCVFVEFEKLIGFKFKFTVNDLCQIESREGGGRTVVPVQL